MELGNFVDNFDGGTPLVTKNVVALAFVSLDFVVSYEDEVPYDEYGLAAMLGNYKRKLTCYHIHFHSS